MKSNQKLSTLFWVRKSKAGKDHRAPLYARISIAGLDEEISMERKVHVDHWDVKAKKDTEGTEDALETNLKMMEAEVKLAKLFKTLKALYENVTPMMLKNAYNDEPVIKENVEAVIVPECHTVLKAFQTFITTFAKQVKKGSRDEGTLRHWKTTRNKVASFIKKEFSTEKFGVIDMDVKEINYTFAERFYEYLTLEVDEPLSEATAKTHIKKTRQILGICAKKDFITKNPFLDFSCGYEETDVIPLELYEVEKICLKKLPAKRLSEVRKSFDFFILPNYW